MPLSSLHFKARHKLIGYKILHFHTRVLIVLHIKKNSSSSPSPHFHIICLHDMNFSAYLIDQLTL